MVQPFPDVPSNLTGVTGFIGYINTVTNGIFGIAILLLVGMVSFLSTKSFTFERSFSFSAFFVLIVGVFLRFMNLISDGVVAFTMAIFLISVIIVMRERDAEGV